MLSAKNAMARGTGHAGRLGAIVLLAPRMTSVCLPSDALACRREDVMGGPVPHPSDRSEGARPQQGGSR